MEQHAEAEERWEEEGGHTKRYEVKLQKKLSAQQSMVWAAV